MFWKKRGLPFGEALASAGAVAILLLTLVAIDERVRDRVSLLIGSRPPTLELASVGARVRDLAAVVIDVGRHQSIEHAPLLIFVLAASVLLLFMLRT